MATMPAKKAQLTDAERARGIEETARKIGVEATQKAFERAFKKVVPDKAQRKAKTK
jgi:hypothetical protein